MIRTRTLIAVAAALIAVLVSGCETFRAIDDSAGRVAKAVKADLAKNNEAARNKQVLTAASPGCDRVDQIITLTNVDPDSVYVRLKRYFGFRTLQEAEKNVYPGWIEATNFRHETVPGVRYAMSHDVVWRSRLLGTKDVWLNLEIERNGRGTFVAWNYCSNTDGFEGNDPVAVQQNLTRDIRRIAYGGGV